MECSSSVKSTIFPFSVIANSTAFAPSVKYPSGALVSSKRYFPKGRVSVSVAAIPSIPVWIVFTVSFFLYSLPSTKTALSFKEMIAKAVSFKVAPPCALVSLVSKSRFWILKQPRITLSDTEYWLLPLNTASSPSSVICATYKPFICSELPAACIYAPSNK